MKVVELNITAARKRKSKVTGFIHHCYEEENNKETIPVFENFCYVLALFRSRIAENILEGRALLEKLLAFQVEENFPVYLHEYPHCKDKTLLSRLRPILDAIAGKEIMPLETGGVWHPKFHTLIGDQQYERGEPAVTLFDLQMGQRYNSFSKRALADHPIHLRAASIPPEDPEQVENIEQYVQKIDGNSLKLWWGDETVTHSFALYNKEGLISDGEDLLIPLSDEEIPLNCFCNIHEDNTLFINGKKGTVFRLGDKVEIHSKNFLKIELLFTLEKGDAAFVGGISQSNRPHTKSLSLFDGYDWQISLRSLKPSPNQTIRVSILVDPENGG